jgi:hypothetical protein
MYVFLRASQHGALHVSLIRQTLCSSLLRKNEQDAAAAREKFDNFQVAGRALRVKPAYREWRDKVSKKLRLLQEVSPETQPKAEPEPAHLSLPCTVRTHRATRGRSTTTPPLVDASMRCVWG